MINIAICDDCKQDINRLKIILQEIMDKYSIHFNIQEYESAESLIETPLAFHLIFLDIIMGGKDGIEIGKQIYRRNSEIKIIFQSNFNTYLQDVINQVHAFAFLEKPLQISSVENQIKEYLESSGQTQEIRIEFRNVKLLAVGKEERKPLINLPAKRILYFEYIKMQKEIKIVTDEEDYIYSETMSKLQDRIKTLGFEICCRGILVNLERIKKIKGYNIILDDGSSVPLSQRRVTQFKERINEYMHDSFN